MNGRRALIGLMVLCALAFSAVAAASASAKGTTAFTCREGQGGANTDAHCDPGSTGTSGHVAIPAGTKTDIHVAATTSQTLTGTVAGNAITLVGSGVEVDPSSTSYLQNTDHGTSPMDVSGTVQLVYTGVEITAGAALKERCEIEGKRVTTESLAVTTSVGETKKTTGLTFTPENVEGIFAHVNIVQKAGAKACPLAGVSAPVTGKVTGNPTGATLAVSAESEELFLNGNAATLTGTVTVSVTSEPGVGPTIPVSLTTTEP